MSGKKVAVLGATGLVGREMLKTLEQRQFQVSELVPLATPRSEGKKVPFCGEEFTVQFLVDGEMAEAARGEDTDARILRIAGDRRCDFLSQPPAALRS